MEQFPLDTFGASEAAACPAPQASDLPAEDVLVEKLATTRRVAIVGASPNPARTSYQVAVWLMENTHYELYLVNPAAEGEEIRGHGFHASLAELPVRVDLVDVFRRAEFVPGIAAAALEAQAGGLWLQSGVHAPDTIADLRSRGVFAVQNRCLKVEYRRYADRIVAARV